MKTSVYVIVSDGSSSSVSITSPPSVSSFLPYPYWTVLQTEQRTTHPTARQHLQEVADVVAAVAIHGEEGDFAGVCTCDGYPEGQFAAVRCGADVFLCHAGGLEMYGFH